MRASIVLLLFVFGLSACHSRKGITEEKIYQKGDLKVIEAYIQTEVPGLEKEEKQTFLYLQFALQEGPIISFQKVSWQDGEAKMQASAYKQRILIPNASKMPIGEFTVYYQKENSEYRQTIPQIELKEPIYRP